MGRLFRVVWIPYVAAGVLACCTAVLTQTMGATGFAVASPAMNRAMGHGSALALAALSSFGAGSGMFGLPHMGGEVRGKRVSAPAYLTWSAAWGLVAATVIMAFLIFIGPGLH